VATVDPDELATLLATRIPLISPAVAGNLVVQSADGTLEDAGVSPDDFIPVVDPATTSNLVKLAADGTLVDGEIALGDMYDGVSLGAGAAFGVGAAAFDGGAIGQNAYAFVGGAVGGGAKATYGGAVGSGAETNDGFAGGRNAKTVSGITRINAIQLGTGTNSTAGTLQVYANQLLDASGNIPAARMTTNLTALFDAKMDKQPTADTGTVVLYDANGNSALSGSLLGVVVVADEYGDPTALQNNMATGTPPNAPGVGSVDLQGNRSAAAQVASGVYAYTEGNATTASGEASHAEGGGTIASGNYAHAEGRASIASGDYSHTEGDSTQAAGAYSHAGGRRAIIDAAHDGAFVRADSTDADFNSTAANEMAVRATGGFRFVTAVTGSTVDKMLALSAGGGHWLYTSDTERDLQRSEILAAALRPSQVDIAGTTHTFALTNEGAIVASQSGSATTFTIPLNSSVAFATNTIIGVEQHGAGALSITATAGVTLNGTDGATETITAQWGAAAIRKTDTNAWVIIGAI
jgi:hypothetical protein